jgi:DNA polymerase I-like protein with 3'-5' exonuclease and polymerase domains
MLGQDGKKVDWANMPLSTMARGNALDAYFTLKIFKKLSKKIDDLKMDNLYAKLIAPSINLFVSMEVDGMGISRSKVDELGTQLMDDIHEKEDSLYSYKEIPDKSMQITSTDDLIKILFSVDKKLNLVNMGFGLFPPISSDKTNAPSTSAEALDILLEQLEEEINRRNG